MSAYNLKLGEHLKKELKALGADLVGYANKERFATTPEMLRPEAQLPECRSVVCIAAHHADASVDFFGEPNPNYSGAFQIGMIPKLDDLACEAARMLRRAGYEAVVIPCTSFWRHRTYKNVPYEHAAPFSHMSAFVAAGLGEYGWHGMVMSPEYGPRVRIVSVITDAPLLPDPLYSGKPLCDRCGNCIRSCPGKNYEKAKLNDPNFIDFTIEGKRFRYPNINRWRCFYGEQAHLDMNDLGSIDKLGEQDILDVIGKGAKRIFGQGYCCSSLKYCMTPMLRAPGYGGAKGPSRKKEKASFDAETAMNAIRRFASDGFAEHISVRPMDAFRGLEGNFWDGFRTEDFYSKFETVITLVREISDFSGIPQLKKRNARELKQAVLRRLEEAQSDIACWMDTMGEDGAQMWDVSGFGERGIALAGLTARDGCELVGISVCVTAKLPDCDIDLDLPVHIEDGAVISGLERVDVLGVGSLADAEGADAETLREMSGGMNTLLAVGCAMDRRTLFLACRQPAEDGSSYVGDQIQMMYRSNQTAQNIASALRHMGYRAVAAEDLTLDSYPTASRLNDFMPGLRVHAPFMAAAGLGSVGRGGFNLHPKYGPRLRCTYILTDAPLKKTEKLSAFCIEGCTACANACGVCAMKADPTAKIMERNEERCAWVRTYALSGEDGAATIGWKLPDMPVPEHPTREQMEALLQEKDPVQVKAYLMPNYTDVVVEKCLQACPLCYRD
ncbi:MAG: hypothetical protein IJC35_07580 [Oscillospiraceae bacterium]|nr:hypothetical protein [Oscillospiraceae bacterium]